jgi:NitT/TauT family transport system ATP-binding protein
LVLLLTRRPTKVAESIWYEAERPRNTATLSSEHFVQTNAACLEIFPREMRR